MNLKTVFEYQKELDLAFSKKQKNQFSKQEIFNMQILAIIVEISEFANEVQSFKFWKQNKNINKEKMLEEFADQIHFLTSLALSFGLESEIKPKIFSNDINSQFLKTFEQITVFKNSPTKNNLLFLYELILGFVPLLKLSEEEIIEAYFNKGQKNYQRIKNNY